MPNALANEQLALDEDVIDRVKKDYIPLLKKIRTDRNTYRETLLRYVRLCTSQRDQQAYAGRSQTFIAETRKLVDNWTRRIVRDLFPTDRWYDIKAVRKAYESKVSGWQALSMYFFTKHARVRRFATPTVRQQVMLGTSPIKVVWHEDIRQLDVLREIMDAQGNPTGKTERQMEEVCKYIGPTFRPIDLFRWYIFPYTVSDVDDAEYVFEDVLVSIDRLKAMARKTIDPNSEDLGFVYVNVDKVEGLRRGEDYPVLSDKRSSGRARDKWDAEARRLSDKGFTHVLDMKLRPEQWPVDVTEGTWVTDLFRDGKTKRYLITLGCDEVILRVQECPFLHQSAHWLAFKFVEFHDEFYGHGLPELVDRLNYTLIDVADQAVDALTWSMNPIAIVDPFLVQDPNSIRMRPGAKWLMNVAGVKFAEPPKDSVTAGLSTVTAIRQLMHDLADVVPVGGPQARQRGQKQQSAAQTQMMISESQVDIKEIVENAEAVMVRFLEMSHSLTEQFLDRDLTLQIAGGEGAEIVEKQISVADIVGDFSYQWLGSVQAQNAQIRSQQNIQLLGMMNQIPQEKLDAQNIEINYKDVIRDAWTAIGNRNADRIIRDKVKQTSVDPKIENQLFRLDRGAEVSVSEADNHTEHAQSHAAALNDPDDAVNENPDRAKALFLHLRGHIAAQLASQMLKQQQQQAQQQPGGGGPPRPGGPPGPGQGAPGAPRPPAPGGPGRVAQPQGLSDLFRQAPRPGLS